MASSHVHTTFAQDGEEECEPEESEGHSMIWHRAGEIDWRARYRATYDVPKSDRRKDTIVVRLDTTVFTAAGALDPPISGEVSTSSASYHDLAPVTTRAHLSD
jgi:hypothetical protein